MSELIVEKNLITESDIAYGEGSVNQTRAGAVHSLPKVSSIRPVNSLGELNALDPVKFPKAILFSGNSFKIYAYSSGWVEQYIGSIDSWAQSTFAPIASWAAIATVTPKYEGQLFYLQQYNSSAPYIGGGQFIAISGTIGDNGITQKDCLGGFYLKRLSYTFTDSRMAGTLDNALPAGATIALEYKRDTYVANSGGTSDIRNFLLTSQLNGGYGAAFLATMNLQSEVRHTAGTVTFSYGIQGFSRLGRLGSTTGNVTTFRGIEWHTANEGSGTITSAMNFYSQAVDLLDGTGTIGQMTGFLCGDQGHATRITTSTIGYDCAEFTAGAPLTVAYRSQMSSGAGRWAFLSSGSANSAFVGNFRLGDNTAPTDKLEVKGYAKISGDGTKTATGNYHEINSTNADYILHVKNTHAALPHGIRLRFTGASPNNTTQEFMRCEDSSNVKMVVYSNGNIVNTNNSYGAYSDVRLKENVFAAPSVLQKFRERKFKTYNFIGSEETVLGVIAQEELEISPHLVSEDKEGFYSYNYAGLATEAAQAVSELVEIVDESNKKVLFLENIVEILSTKLNALEAKLGQ